jgi:hypothetical protein
MTCKLNLALVGISAHERHLLRNRIDRRPVFAYDESVLPRDRQGADVEYRDGAMDRQAASFGRESRRTLPGRSVSSLIALVACFGLVVWAVRFVWERQQPERAALRELNSPTASDRVHALRELGQFGHEDPGALIPPLIAALKDSDTAVRVRAADALMYVGSEALTGGSANRLVGGAD